MDPPILVGGCPYGREGSLLLAARMMEELGGSIVTRRTQPEKKERKKRFRARKQSTKFPRTHGAERCYFLNTLFIAYNFITWCALLPKPKDPSEKNASLKRMRSLTRE